MRRNPDANTPIKHSKRCTDYFLCPEIISNRETFSWNSSAASARHSMVIRVITLTQMHCNFSSAIYAQRTRHYHCRITNAALLKMIIILRKPNKLFQHNDQIFIPFDFLLLFSYLFFDWTDGVWTEGTFPYSLIMLKKNFVLRQNRTEKEKDI